MRVEGGRGCANESSNPSSFGGRCTGCGFLLLSSQDFDCFGRRLFIDSHSPERCLALQIYVFGCKQAYSPSAKIVSQTRHRQRNPAPLRPPEAAEKRSTGSLTSHSSLGDEYRQ